MRKPRGFLSRAFATAMVIWLGLVITEPLPLHACPMHGVHSMHATVDMGHSMHHEKTASHQCTCLGDCTAGVGTALPQTAAVHFKARVAFYSAVAFGGASRVIAGAGEHLLPFANGPPAPGSA
jgi:hypothetical protein